MEGAQMRDFKKSRQLPELQSLISITRIPSHQRSEANFIREWNQTLQLIRDISERLIKPENKPNWITGNVPKGVIADQFLHAYYYNQVKEGSSYPYREFNQKNKENPENALLVAIDWWRNLGSAPSSEDIHINEWAPEIRERLSRGIIVGMSEQDFIEVCFRTHAIRDHAARIGHQVFGLEHQLHKMSRDERAKYFGSWLYQQRSHDGSTPCEIIDFVLYGGLVNETPKRLFEACSNSDQKIPHLGISSLGEIIGWAMPDDFPPRNGRTSKALTALGFDVKIHSE
jgi:hypothetical protein